MVSTTLYDAFAFQFSHPSLRAHFLGSPRQNRYPSAAQLRCQWHNATVFGARQISLKLTERATYLMNNVSVNIGE